MGHAAVQHSLWPCCGVLDQVLEDPWIHLTLLCASWRPLGELCRVFIQASGAVIIRRSSFADNNQGVYIQSDTSGVVEDSRFVGVTSNIGTPPSLYTCKREYGPRYCAPIKGCQ